MSSPRLSVARRTAIAVDQAERDRARIGLTVAAVIAASGAGIGQLGAGEGPEHWLLTVMLLATAAASAYLALAFRRRRVSSIELRSMGAILSLTALAALAYTGLTGAVAIVLCALVYAYGGTRDRIKGRIVYGTSASGHLLLSVLAVIGVIDYEGVLNTVAAAYPIPTIIVDTLLVQLVMATTFYLARRTRTVLDDVVRKVQEAQTELAEREALLHEARADLSQAVDAARLGRFSGRRVDQFEVAEIIGRGAMGEVYRALRIDSDDEVAIKVMHPHHVADEEWLHRFRRETAACIALRSPHIVRVIDGGTTDDGCPYFAMERLAGIDLATILRRQKALSQSEVVTLVAQVASALGDAHAANIVHRDVKPQNLFRTRDRSGKVCWKVLDFGISKFIDATQVSDTGQVIGTPAYMAPEQARGHTVDPRCDIFALGLIAYRTLTGRPAFSDKDPVRLIVSIARDQPLAPGLGEQIDVVLALALAKDPSQRFTTVARFAEALAQAARGELSPALLSCGRALLCAHPWRQHRHDAPLETPPLGDATTELGTELLPTAQLHEAIALS